MDVAWTRARAPRGFATRLGLAMAVTLLALVPQLAPLPVSAATAAWIDTGGDCLNFRSAPGLSSTSIDCLDHGTEIALLDAVQQVDGFSWQQASHGGQTGWLANFYITTDPAEVQVINEPTNATGGGLAVPPAGGMTIGVATDSDPAALVAAQSYPVAGVWGLDIPTQELRQYLPGAPSFVNTLTSIPSGGVVALRRAGTLTAAGAPPAASLTVAGTPNQLATPPVGGLTQGISGTTDPKFLVQAQSFTVQSVSYFHVASQQWLIYLPGAPAHVQTLAQGQLRVDSVVSLTRGPDAPAGTSTAPEAPSDDAGGETPDDAGGDPAGDPVGEPGETVPEGTPGVPFETTITYYYCVPGTIPASIGDGGGYCGGMANGQIVHDGAAACSPGKLGQRFTIEGDPTGRIYTCEDTGGSVLNDHRDIWFMHSDEGYTWWVQVGARANITILAD